MFWSIIYSLYELYQSTYSQTNEMISTGSGAEASPLIETINRDAILLAYPFSWYRSLI